MSFFLGLCILCISVCSLLSYEPHSFVCSCVLKMYGNVCVYVGTCVAFVFPQLGAGSCKEHLLGTFWW